MEIEQFAPIRTALFTLGIFSIIGCIPGKKGKILVRFQLVKKSSCFSDAIKILERFEYVNGSEYRKKNIIFDKS